MNLKVYQKLSIMFDDNHREFPLNDFEFTFIRIPKIVVTYTSYFVNLMPMLYILGMFIVFILATLSRFPNLQSKISALVEKELSAIDDFMIMFMMITILFFYGYFGCFNVFLFLSDHRVVITTVTVVLSSVLLIPVTMVISFGFYVTQFIRGAGTTLNFAYELVLDNINITSFFLRLVIQAVRLVIITTVYLGYNHLILEYNFNLHMVSYDEYSEGQTKSILLYARYVFEVGHIFAIFFAQFCAFLLMLFWLFQFLFTLFTGYPLEFSKRNTK